MLELTTAGTPTIQTPASSNANMALNPNGTGTLLIGGTVPTITTAAGDLKLDSAGGDIVFDADIEMTGEDNATDSGGMLDDFLDDDNDKKEDQITSDNVEWDYVDEKENNPKEIVVKEKKDLSVNCVISAKYKEKKEYLFVLTNEDTLIEQTVDKQMFKTFEEGDEVVYKKLEKGFKIVKK